MFSVTLELMRLLVEALIIAVLIFLGWNRPFGDQAAQIKTSINRTFDSLGGYLQKNQDSSVKRY
jgi:hypothetical protein